MTTPLPDLFSGLSSMQQPGLHFCLLLLGYFIYTHRRTSSTKVPENLMDPAYWAGRW